MSDNTVDLYNEKKKELIEDGSFSQSAIVDGVTIYGIFDNHYSLGSKDGGNVTQQFKKPRFIVDIAPSFTPNVTKITINSVDYTITKSTPDKNGYVVLWLR
jgi:hypothetical protein